MRICSDLTYSRMAGPFLVLAGLVATTPALPGQEIKVTVEQVLKYKPAQQGVQYDTPAGEDLKQCKLDVDKVGNGSAWIVLDPQGMVLRRFVDSDGNGTVDQFRYYQHGMEVYRDVDRNENRTIDESRWLNMGGSRWGVDADEDGTIDSWKMISAEEATKVAIEAMVAGDVKSLTSVLISEEDIQTLGVEQGLAGELQESVKAPAEQLQKVRTGSKVIAPGAKWMRFDTSMLMPGVIPEESGKAGQDLHVYENVMALVDTAGQTGFVLVGEIVRVGDNWKLTRIPLPIEGDTAQIPGGEGILMQPEQMGLDAMPAGDLPPEVRKLLEELSALDKDAPDPSSPAKEVSEYHVSRARLLGELAKVAKTPEEREQWKRQQVDGIAAATQTGTFPNGLQQLQAIEEEVRESNNAVLVPYIVFRRILAEYNTKLQNAEAAKDREEIQAWWLEQLESFVKTHTTAEDSPDAALQLAIGLEFSGKLKQAREWYEAIVKNFPTAPAAKRARGAVRRLDLVGKPLNFSADVLGGGQVDLARYKGRVVLVIFWATWCEPCTRDLPQIQALYKQYQRNGFEVVGVNLDMPGAPIKEYIDNYKVTWPQIHEEGGLESRPASDFGIISLPTMLLVDKTGNVTSVSTSVDDLKEQIPELLK
jgi:thiol-disulfide isomerase/thioredoxin